MFNKKAGSLAAGAALLSVLAFAGPAAASCGNSDRVSISDSDCLSATWTNSHWDASNLCTHKIKIKIDIKNGSDKTKTMNAAVKREVCYNTGYSTECHIATYPAEASGSIDTNWGRKIRNVKCCSDYDSCDHK